MGGSTVTNLDVTAEAGRQEVIVKRVFNAPRERVFATYVDPDAIPNWWGPRGLSTVVESYEVRPGGRWRFVQREPGGREYGFHGVCHDTVPNERIVQTFEFEGMPGHVSLDTVTFAERDGRTEVTAQSVFQSVEDRDGMLASGMTSGMAETYDRLAELVER